MNVARRQMLTWTIGLGLLALYYSLAIEFCGGSACGDSLFRILNFFGQAALIALAVLVIMRGIARDRSLLWTPVVVFPMATALYFGFGNMFWILGDAGVLYRFSSHRYYVTLEDLTKANHLSMVGLVVASMVMTAALRLRLTPGRFSGHGWFARPKLSIEKTAIVLIGTGLAIEAMEILLGMLGGPEAQLPGLLRNLAALTDLGLALAFYLGLRGNRTWLVIFWCIWPVYVGYSLLDLSKKTLMLSILLPAAAAYLAHGRVSRILPFVLLAGLTFAFVQDVNSDGRIQLRANVEEGIANTPLARVNILLDTLGARGAIDAAQAVSQIWWQRLSYAGPQIRAMEFREAGQSTTWTVNPLVYVIPRALWPGKPEMPALGRDFNQLVSGLFDQTTRVGITIYANGYWMMGWWGVVLFASVYGLILALVTRINHAIISEQNFIYLPAVFVGLSIGALGQMGFFETSVLGGPSVYLGLIVVTRYGIIFAHQLLGRRHNGRATA